MGSGTHGGARRAPCGEGARVHALEPEGVRCTRDVGRARVRARVIAGAGEGLRAWIYAGDNQYIERYCTRCFTQQIRWNDRTMSGSARGVRSRIRSSQAAEGSAKWRCNDECTDPMYHRSETCMPLGMEWCMVAPHSRMIHPHAHASAGRASRPQILSCPTPARDGVPQARTTAGASLPGSAGRPRDQPQRGSAEPRGRQIPWRRRPRPGSQWWSRAES